MFRIILFLFLFYSSYLIYAADIKLLAFDNELQDWEEEIFSNKTLYEITSIQNKRALKAISNQSASGLFIRKRIDLLKTPIISWSWLTTQKLPELEEQSKSGDDYVARIYVVIEGGIRIWKTRSLNYVWSSSQKSGVVWDNAYAGSNVKMLSIQGKDAETNRWYYEKRNVYEDLIQYFGDKGSDKANLKAYRYIDIIALMTDTDNSLSKAESYYGEISFSSY